MEKLQLLSETFKTYMLRSLLYKAIALAQFSSSPLHNILYLLCTQAMHVLWLTIKIKN